MISKLILSKYFKAAHESVHKLFETNDYDKVIAISAYLALLESQLCLISPEFKNWVDSREDNSIADATTSVTGVLAIDKMPNTVKDELVDLGFFTADKTTIDGKEVEAYRMKDPKELTKLIEDPYIRTRMSSSAKAYLKEIIQKIVGEANKIVTEKINAKNKKGDYAESRSGAVEGDKKEEGAASGDSEEGEKSQGDPVSYFRRC